MNAIGSGRLHIFEAEAHTRPRGRGQARRDFCRPVRMQGAGWGEESAARAHRAWRRAFLRGAIWRRALLAGLVVTVVSGIAGVREETLLGLAAAAGAVFVQCWQSSDERRHQDAVQWN